VNVIPISQPAEFLLTGGIPAIESNRPAVGVKIERVHRHANRGEVFLLKLTSQVTLDERRFTCFYVIILSKNNIIEKQRKRKRETRVSRCSSKNRRNRRSSTRKEEDERKGDRSTAQNFAADRSSPFKKKFPLMGFSKAL
jgi:hypothetical protein